jgi:hypothetical protein
MIYMGFMFVLAYANNLNVPVWAWVLFWLQVSFEIIIFIAKVRKLILEE